MVGRLQLAASKWLKMYNQGVTWTQDKFNMKYNYILSRKCASANMK